MEAEKKEMKAWYNAEMLNLKQKLTDLSENKLPEVERSFSAKLQEKEQEANDTVTTLENKLKTT